MSYALTFTLRMLIQLHASSWCIHDMWWTDWSFGPRDRSHFWPRVTHVSDHGIDDILGYPENVIFEPRTDFDRFDPFLTPPVFWPPPFLTPRFGPLEPRPQAQIGGLEPTLLIYKRAAPPSPWSEEGVIGESNGNMGQKWPLFDHFGVIFRGKHVQNGQKRVKKGQKGSKMTFLGYTRKGSKSVIL